MELFIPNPLELPQVDHRAKDQALRTLTDSTQELQMKVNNGDTNIMSIMWVLNNIGESVSRLSEFEDKMS